MSIRGEGAVPAIVARRCSGFVPRVACNLSERHRRKGWEFRILRQGGYRQSGQTCWGRENDSVLAIRQLCRGDEVGTQGRVLLIHMGVHELHRPLDGQVHVPSV